jgi:hypothetical protein
MGAPHFRPKLPGHRQQLMGRELAPSGRGKVATLAQRTDAINHIAKLRGARERKRREAGKCEGRKSHAERNPELVALAKRLHRRKPKGGRMSLRAISAELVGSV